VPSAIAGACGLIAIDASAAGFTVSVAAALTPFELIPIVVTPVPNVVANPAVPAVSLIVATVAVVELQCPLCVTSCVLPSVNVPVAVNCCVVPSASVGVAGVTVIDTSSAEVTISVVDPVTAPTLAAIVALPCPTPLALPCVPTPSLIVATVSVSELHCTVPVMFCVLPSV
jgi:hypothetical protein